MKISFISNKHDACGIGQYGRLMADAMERYSKNEVSIYYVDTIEDIDCRQEEIFNSDLAFINYNPSAMTNYSECCLFKNKKIPVLGVVHDYGYFRYEMYSMLSDIFQYRILLNPIFSSAIPNVFSSPRIVPDIEVEERKNEIPTFGFFGLSVNKESLNSIFDKISKNYGNAVINLHFPPPYFGSNNCKNEQECVDACKSFSNKFNFLINCSFDLLSQEELVQKFLAQNDMNICFRPIVETGGISSRVDYAIAAERPIAFSDSNMHRHIKFYAPELFIEKNSLKRIQEVGKEKVIKLKELWHPRNAALCYDDVFKKIIQDWKKLRTVRYNTVLDDSLRTFYQEQNSEIARLCPDKYSLKIPEANVQQGFVKAKVEEFAQKDSRMLCIGCYDDTAYLALQAKGYVVEGIDPELNIDLNQHFEQWDASKPYDVIFSTSVIEHVPDDIEFIEKIVSMLAPGGYAILTMDYKEIQSEMDKKFTANLRFYSSSYILNKLAPALLGCELVDCYDWNKYKPDFNFAGYDYSFATLVFRKKNYLSDADIFFKNEMDNIFLYNQKNLSLKDKVKAKLSKFPYVYKLASKSYKFIDRINKI